MRARLFLLTSSLSFVMVGLACLPDLVLSQPDADADAAPAKPCGDGVVDLDAEQCDPGSDDAAIGCTATCALDCDGGLVDPSTNQVVLAINNHLGNWSPADAAAFRGRGPIQITGRYNYQKFADYAGLPALMNNPSMLANTAAPALGMEAAGWFWETLYNHHLNETADSFAGQSTSAFNTAVTKVINPGFLALSNRLGSYLRIRALLLSAGF